MNCHLFLFVIYFFIFFTLLFCNGTPLLPWLTPCVETHLPKVLLKVSQLQALLQFQLVFGPELLEGILRLIQLGQKPKKTGLYTARSLKVKMQHKLRYNSSSPLHRDLIFQLVWAQLVLLQPAGWLFDTAQQGGALLHRQLQFILVKRNITRCSVEHHSVVIITHFTQKKIQVHRIIRWPIGARQDTTTKRAAKKRL